MKVKGQKERGKIEHRRRQIRTWFVLPFTLLLLTFAVSAQRDYLTAEEIEVVRDTQQIDERIDVLIHAMDRRFAVLQVAVGAPSKKPRGEWGEPPKGSRSELLYDIKRILRKAVDDIDNLSERPDSMLTNPDDKKPKGFAELFPKAVRKLDAAARRYQPALKGLLDTAKEAGEQGSILVSLEMCQQITAASGKLAPEVKKAKN